MRRPLAALAICAAAGVASAAYLTKTPGRVVPPIAVAASTLPAAATAPPPPVAPAAPSPLAALPAAVPTAAQVRATATAWVTAMWTRRPGQGPFDWLAQVAPITDPGLLAQLHTALPTAADQQTLSVTVVIDGVYPSAVDPATVTVTCDAHIVTTGGDVDQPCATTVTVAENADGQPVVTQVQ